MKKIIYIISWIVLGILLSFIAHAVIEMIYISYALSHDITLGNNMLFGNGYCALPAWVQLILPILGIVMGYMAGVYFWRVIYIEKRYLKRWVK